MSDEKPKADVPAVVASDAEPHAKRLAALEASVAKNEGILEGFCKRLEGFIGTDPASGKTGTPGKGIAPAIATKPILEKDKDTLMDIASLDWLFNPRDND